MTREKAKANLRHRVLLSAHFLMLGGLTCFVAAAFATQYLIGLSTPVHLGPLAGLLFCSIPALLWLGYFCNQDRLEPEPKHHLLGAFLLGAFFAGPIASFAIHQATGLGGNTLQLQALSVERWIEALAIIGIAQETSKYIAIRYTLYRSSEFDEPLNGIITMTATGLGFATYLSYQDLFSNGGAITLSAGAAQTVVTSLGDWC